MIVIEIPTFYCTKCYNPYVGEIKLEKEREHNISVDKVLFKHYDIVDFPCPEDGVELEVPLSSFLKSLQ